MSFTSDVREELCGFPVHQETVKAEIAGFLKFKGTLDIGKTPHLELSVKDTCSARRVKRLFALLKNTRVEVMYHDEKRLKAGRIFLLKITVDDLSFFLRGLGLDEIGNVKGEFFSDPASFSAFLRGAFIASGSIANPSRYHHLELYHRHRESLLWILKTLKDLFGIKGYMVDVRYGYRFYLKDGEMIGEFLNLIGAGKSARMIESIMMMNRIHSDVTRSVNFIEANSKRSGLASLKQIEIIREIESLIGLDSLPEEIHEVAKLRLEHPEVSLRELGMMTEPPISKSIVYRRLMKVFEIAEKGVLDR